MGPLIHLICISLGFSHVCSPFLMVWGTLYSWFYHMFSVCFSRNISMVSASPSRLGRFLEDLSKLKNYSFHSCLFPDRLHRTTTYTIFLSSVISFYAFFLFIRRLRKASICASTFLFVGRPYEFILTSSFIIHYLQTRRNCTHCFPFNYHYSIVMNIPPNTVGRKISRFLLKVYGSHKWLPEFQCIQFCCPCKRFQVIFNP